MERVDRLGNQVAASTTQVRRAVPDPRGHATLLVREYGIAKALQIAQANSSIVHSDDYWSNVFVALGGQCDPMRTAQQLE